MGNIPSIRFTFILSLVAITITSFGWNNKTILENKKDKKYYEPNSEQKVKTEKRIIITDTAYVEYDTSYKGKKKGYLLYGDTVNVKNKGDIPEPEFYRDKVEIYRNGNKVGTIRPSTVGVLEGKMRAVKEVNVYSRRDTTSNVRATINKGSTVKVRNLNKGFYEAPNLIGGFVKTDYLHTNRQYWNAIADVYDLWIEKMWSNFYSGRLFFTGYSWEFGENFSKDKKPEDVTLKVELSVDRIEWGRTSDYKKKKVVDKSYQNLKRNYYDFEGEANYCPYLSFKVDGPRIQEMTVAAANCEEAWYK